MFVVFLASLLAAAPPSTPTCAVDSEAMMALDVQAFDQDMKGGWRPLSLRPECEETAADLIALYRQRHPDAGYLLAWHEGQIRLSLNQSKRAIALLDSARKPPSPPGMDTGWNAYVDATVAFARGDLNALRTARAQLAALPKPPKFPADIKWPMNLAVVDGMINCFGQPYHKAYALACRPTSGK